MKVAAVRPISGPGEKILEPERMMMVAARKITWEAAAAGTLVAVGTQWHAFRPVALGAEPEPRQWESQPVDREHRVWVLANSSSALMAPLTSC
jgi:hypothetical protein